MKKILSLALAAAISAAAVPALAAEAEPVIKVNGRTIVFRDEQAPVIQNDRLYVPLRRVLNSMGANVDWNDEKRTVTINSYDNIKRLILTIDNPEITLYTFTSVLHADETKITSDVAPVIINDRTMLPIRVIAETLGSTVDWDAEQLLTEITTEQAKSYAASKDVTLPETEIALADAFKDNLPKIGIASDADGVKQGDTVTLKVQLKDIAKIADTAKLCSTTVSVMYDSENFAYDGFKIIDGGEERDPQLSANNPEFMEGCAKIVTLDLPANAYLPAEDGTVMEIYMTALNDNGGKFSLSDGVTNLGNNTEIVVTVDGENYFSLSDYTELYIDTTPIEVK